MSSEKSTIVECRQKGLVGVGSYTTEANINAVVDKATELRSVGAEMDRNSEEIFGKGNKLGLTPKDDNPQQNLQILRANRSVVLEHTRQTRDVSRAGVIPTPGIEPRSSITVTPPITGTELVTKTEYITKTITNTVTIPATDSAEYQTGSVLLAIADWPARWLRPDSQQPNRVGIDIAGWLLATYLAAGLLVDRPRNWLQRVRLNRLQTRVRHTIEWPFLLAEHRLHVRAHHRGLAAGTIPAGTPAPTPTYPRIWTD